MAFYDYNPEWSENVLRVIHSTTSATPHPTDEFSNRLRGIHSKKADDKLPKEYEYARDYVAQNCEYALGKKVEIYQVFREYVNDSHFQKKLPILQYAHFMAVIEKYIIVKNEKHATPTPIRREGSYWLDIQLKPKEERITVKENIVRPYEERANNDREYKTKVVDYTAHKGIMEAADKFNVTTKVIQDWWEEIYGEPFAEEAEFSTPEKDTKEPPKKAKGKTVRKSRKYTDEEKLNALLWAQEHGVNVAAKELGIPGGTIRGWADYLGIKVTSRKKKESATSKAAKKANTKETTAKMTKTSTSADDIASRVRGLIEENNMLRERLADIENAFKEQ